jgi:hypothetical protein
MGLEVIKDVSVDRPELSAAEWNAIRRMAKRADDAAIRTPSGGGSSGPGTPSLKVLIRNDSGALVAARSVLKVTGALAEFAANPLQAMATPVVSGDDPDAITNAVVVTEEPIANGEYGRAVLSGVATCTVNIVSTAHGYAVPTVGDATKLTSAIAGSTRILAGNGSTGNQSCMVLLQTWPEPQYYSSVTTLPSTSAEPYFASVTTSSTSGSRSLTYYPNDLTTKAIWLPSGSTVSDSPPNNNTYGDNRWMISVSTNMVVYQSPSTTIDFEIVPYLGLEYYNGTTWTSSSYSAMAFRGQNLTAATSPGGVHSVTGPYSSGLLTGGAGTYDGWASSVTLLASLESGAYDIGPSGGTEYGMYIRPYVLLKLWSSAAMAFVVFDAIDQNTVVINAVKAPRTVGQKGTF